METIKGTVYNYTDLFKGPQISLVRVKQMKEWEVRKKGQKILKSLALEIKYIDIHFFPLIELNVQVCSSATALLNIIHQHHHLCL